MDSENDNGGSREHTEYNIQPRQSIQSFQRERKTFETSGTRDREVRRSSVGSDGSESSGEVRKKRCRETDNARKDSPDSKEDEPGDGGILSKAMEEELQQITQKMDYFTHQVLELLETGKACFEDASTAFQERVLQYLPLLNCRRKCSKHGKRKSKDSGTWTLPTRRCALVYTKHELLLKSYRPRQQKCVVLVPCPTDHDQVRNPLNDDKYSTCSCRFHCYQY